MTNICVVSPRSRNEVTLRTNCEGLATHCRYST